MARKFYRQIVTVIDNRKTFAAMDLGQCFTALADPGFGELWVGFPIWIKASDSTAISIEDGDFRAFAPSNEYLLVRYGAVEKPIK